MPVLEQLCRRIEHVGALGSGATMKLAVICRWWCTGRRLAKPWRICKPLNLPADRLIDILSTPLHADRHERARRRDRQGIGGAPMGDTRFGLSAAKKDLATPVQFGASIHADCPSRQAPFACL